MVKEKKVTAATAGAAPRMSSRISEQMVKRKAVEQSSPVSAKKRKSPGESVKEIEDKSKETPAQNKQSKKKAATLANDEKTSENEEFAVEDDATTKALVEEIDVSDDDGNGKKSVTVGASLFQRGQDVGNAPATAAKIAAKTQAVMSKKNNNAESGTVKDKSTVKHGAAVSASASFIVGKGSESGGVVYVGRIPHGFFEHEMRSYFGQFGDIRNLRLSRNRKTGASKHYAFIEFSDREVAEIVAKTMDNYLLFGHLLRCSVVTPDRIPANLFKGANRRFKAVPWNRMAGRKLGQPKPESEWADKISRETKKRAERAALLKSKLDYSFAPPNLKTTDMVEATNVLGKIEEKKEDKALKLLQEAASAGDLVAAISTAPAIGKKVKGKKMAA